MNGKIIGEIIKVGGIRNRIREFQGIYLDISRLFGDIDTGKEFNYSKAYSIDLYLI